MAILKFLFILNILCSCSKIKYLMDQGRGQREILKLARANREVLKDSSVPIEYKKKIRKIIELKNFYYDFWKTEKSEIYSKTAFLKTQAVSYLVVASPINKIEAREECFPFFGCFPYLGFFRENLAKEYASELVRDGYSVYIRPVLAYSTLGYFDDPILSSMLVLDDYDLAETVFHELFHTTLFIKNEVNLNEALADLVGQEMTAIYYSFNKASKDKRDKKRERKRKLEKLLVEKTNRLNNIYGYHKDLQPFQAKGILNRFLKEEFFPEIKKECHALKVSDNECFPFKVDWNNAAFTSFLTYEGEDERLSILRKNLNLNLQGFVEFIKVSYKEYKRYKENRVTSFPDFLLLKAQKYATYNIFKSSRIPKN